MSSKGFGRPCPDCGHSQYSHPGGKLTAKTVFNDAGEIVGYNRGCELRLTSYTTMSDVSTGEIVQLAGYAPDSPFPRTKQDPRAWRHVTNLQAR